MTLSAELSNLQEIIEGYASDFGLDFFPKFGFDADIREDAVVCIL